ncbi:MAG: Xaa-Pro peptidase family protein, partial [Octadecabacter sp.]
AMTLHFDAPEFAARQSRATQAVQAAGLDAVLLFAPESHLWLTGYDTFGFAMFQTMVLTATGDIHLLTRMPDLRQARHTSTLSDDHIHIWPEFEGCDPAQDLSRLLADLNVSGTIGYESDTAGLTDFNGQRLRATLPGLQDHSNLIRALRRVKSPAEVVMHRTAAALSDDALDAALAITHAGAFEGDILAAMQGAVFKGGGDYAGNEFIIGSGAGALLCRYFSGRRHLEAQDQLTLEWSGAYARYHAAMMRTVLTGTPSNTHIRMHAAAAEALEACEDAIKPGAPMGDVYAAHARVFDAHGFSHAQLQACGYGMGAVYNPIWVDFPMFYEGNPLLMQRNQVFFLHMILMDSDVGAAMTLGHSVLVTDTGCERLSRHPLDLLVR